jgi:hypothetical protein
VSPSKQLTVSPSRQCQQAVIGSLPEPAETFGPEPERNSTAFYLVMVIALYALPALVTLRPGPDWDAWWHLRTGQWVVEHRTVPVTDPFSSFGPDRPWVAYSWLFEVLLYGLFQAFGLAGLLVYRVLLALAVLAALHRLVGRREKRFLVGTGLVGLGFLALVMMFTERPWLFTILFSAWTVDVILDLRAGRGNGLVWVLPFCYALWANLHVQFVCGLMLLALACAAPVGDRWLGLVPSGKGAALAGTRAWWSLVALSGACLLATLGNPYGIRLYEVVVEYATQPGPFRLISELTAPSFRELSDWVTLALVGGAAFALGRRQSLSSFDVLLLAGTAVFAFRARRDCWFVVLAALAILATAGRDAASAECFTLTRRHWGIVLGAVALVTALTALARGLSPARLWAETANRFPVEAAAMVAERGYAGPLYNDFNWGGYLIWSLPQLPVALDGRTNLYGDARLQRFINTWAAAPDWREDADLAGAGVVIANRDTPLVSLLERDERFVLVHEDPVAKVFVAWRNVSP